MEHDVTTYGAREEPSLWKGALSGAIAGAASGFMMEQFQTKVMPRVQSAVKEARKRVQDVDEAQAERRNVQDVGTRGSAASAELSHPREKIVQSELGPQQAVATQRVPQAESEIGSAGSTESGETARRHEEKKEQSEPSTVKAAEMVAEPVLGRELKGDEKKIAGEASHYWMATTSGAIYGIAAEYSPRVTMGYGTAFGTAVWAIADEMIVPTVIQGKKPFSGTMSTHAYALASHLVYGAMTELVRRQVRPQLDRF